MTAEQSYCAACPVETGECPLCGTFWVRASGGWPGAKYGIRPQTGEAWEAWKVANNIERDEPCPCCGKPRAVVSALLLQMLPNVVSVGTAWPGTPALRSRS